MNKVEQLYHPGASLATNADSTFTKDLDLIVRVMRRQLQKKTRVHGHERHDVVIKTIFRVKRQFYKKRLDEVLGKRRKNKPRPEILGSLGRLADSLLRNAFKIIDPAITEESLANYLGALIMPKVI